jgi:hypothetical protein
MTVNRTLFGQDEPVNRSESIRDLFAESGGAMGTRDFALLCIDHGLYSGDELERAQINWVQGEIRRVLKKSDASGLPFAGQTIDRGESGEPVWKQRRYWDYEDYEINVQEHLRNRDENHTAALALSRECSARFGRSPFIPSVEAA